MAKDSQYYKNKNTALKKKYKKISAQLPTFAIQYLDSKSVNAQPNTLISYARDLRTFFVFLQERKPMFKNIPMEKIRLQDMEQISADDIIEYMRYLDYNDRDGETYHDNSKAATKRKLAPLRAMYNYHCKRNNLQQNPVLLVEMPKPKKDKNIVHMNQKEVENLLHVVEQGSDTMGAKQKLWVEKTRIRDTALILLLLGTGIRVSECVGLDCSDLNFDENSITIVRKGGAQDILYFNTEVEEAMKKYVAYRNTLTPLKGHEDALFLSRQGKRIGVRGIENLVKKYTKIAVPNKNITVHKIRSTFGTALYEQSNDIRLVAEVLGHEDMNVTKNYYAALGDKAKRRAATMPIRK